MRNIQFTREENLVFWKNLLLIGLFFLITPITLIISIVSLFSLQTTKLNTLAFENKTADSYSTGFSGVQVYASLPSKIPSVSGEIGIGDARGIIVKNYLKQYNSPLLPYAEDIVKNSDKYGLDYRLLPAIAQQESNLCKIIPPNSYNCWGWGINSQSNLGFDSFPEGIEIVARGLKLQYLDKGLHTVYQIMSKYNPNSPDGAWAKGVSQFMSEME